MLFCARVEQGERMTREREVFLVRSWDWVQKHSGNNLNLNAQRSHLTVFASSALARSLNRSTARHSLSLYVFPVLSEVGGALGCIAAGHMRVHVRYRSRV